MQKKQDLEEDILYDFIYMKFQNKKILTFDGRNQSNSCLVALVGGRRGDVE